jgi:hypothetical protein
MSEREYEIRTEDNDTVIVGRDFLELDQGEGDDEIGIRAEMTPTEMRRVARMLLAQADAAEGIELE